MAIGQECRESSEWITEAVADLLPPVVPVDRTPQAAIGTATRPQL